MSNKFFFFGCWNNDNCYYDLNANSSSCYATDGGEEKCNAENLNCNKQSQSKYDWRGMVLEELGKDKFNFGVIAGDNVYSRENANGNKSYYQETINSGFNALKANAPKHAILGNHNVAHESITNAQRSHTTEIFKLYEDFVTPVDISKNTFLFLNTNLLVKYMPEQIKCIFEAELNKAKHNKIFVVGHEPLIAAKAKKGQSLVQAPNAGILLNACFNFMDHDTNKQIYYLCADVHNFQILYVSRGSSRALPIIIAGTGGAEPDLCVFKNLKTYLKKHNININGVEYNINFQAIHKPFGYCIIESNSYNNINVTYKRLTNKTKDVNLTQQVKNELVNFQLQNINISTLKECPPFSSKTKPLYTKTKAKDKKSK